MHPFGDDVLEAPDIGEHAVHHFNVIDEDNAVVLVEFEGAADRISDPEAAFSVTVSESGDSTFVFAHIPPNGWAERLSPFTRADEVFIEMPMYYSEDGAMEVTAVGKREALQATTAALPEAVTVEVLSTGPYAPSHRRLYERLTHRQLETLRTAVQVGYYDVQRSVGYEAVGEELGISADTVGEHLRKIESTIFTDVLRPETDQRSRVG
ncbi:MAG: hypothetical protein ACI8UR_002488 [Natronomonas sp.]|jgi:hypothetical protein|uniref:helix-turn-helix domain-containing protein n=1 Tax=Natronomonas sp. TaxID=2184060 RepID=UPI003988D5DA